MARITKIQKQIADAHINAKLNKSFTDHTAASATELIEGLKAGRTYAKFLDEIEVRFVPVTSLIAMVYGHVSGSYKAAVYRAVKGVCNKYGIA